MSDELHSPEYIEARDDYQAMIAGLYRLALDHGVDSRVYRDFRNGEFLEYERNFKAWLDREK